jgi:YD repeat-containing protein
MTRFHLKLLIILSQISFSTKVFSQDVKPEIINMIPASPNAASLAKFGQFPVTYFTGLPQISVPLFEASSGKLHVPVSLSYHAAGVRVEDIASWVGLGWALNTGGVITRQVHGIEDEGINGYFHPIFKASQLANYSNTADAHTPENNYLREVGKGRGDTQADVFFFNMEGMSGKFIYNQEDKVFYTIPRQNIKIQSINEGRTGFKIITPSGNTYNFDVLEKTTSSSICNPAIADSKTVTSAWYLSSIISFDKKDTINYSYESRNLRYETLGGETRNFLTAYYSNGGGMYGDLQDTYCTQQISINEQKLTKISFRGGDISFNSAIINRCDLLNSAALDNIELKNSEGTTLRKWQFSYSYFTQSAAGTSCTDYSESLGKRLKLDSLKEVTSSSGTILLKRPYRFTYKNEQLLPSRMSKAQDYWGFYNGKTTNSTLIPSYAIAAYNKLTYFEGGNRDVDTTYTAAGSMTKIFYPTGGFTEFFFENNRIVDSTISIKPLFKNVILDTAGFMPSRPRFEKTFTINEPPSELNSWRGGAFVTLRFGSPGCIISPNTGATNCAQFILKGVDNTSINSGVLLSNVTSYYPNGTYKLTATFSQNPPNYYDFYFTASWSYQDTTFNTLRFTGGLRLKKTIDYDGISHQNDLVSRFDYSRENNSLLSSGRITGFPLVNNFMQKEFLDRYYYTGDWFADRSVTKISSFSNQSLNQTAGAYTTYQFVTAYKGNNGEGGKTTYKFLQTQDMLSQIFPYVSFNNDWKRGQLLEQVDYRKNNGIFFPIKRVKNTYGYNLIAPKYSISLKTYFARSTNGSSDQATFSIPNWDEYTDESNWIGLLQASTQIYDNTDTTKSTISVDEFTYSPVHFGVLAQKQTKSDGNVNITKFKYPQDYVGITANNKLSNSIKYLQTNNISSMPVEVVRQRINSLGNIFTISAQYNSFKENNAVLDTIWLADIKGGADMFISSSVSTGSVNKSLTYYPKVSFDQYNLYNNLVQQSLIGSSKSIYIWSYNNRYLIAEIKNSNYSSIESALGGASAVTAFANKPNPEKAEIIAFLSPIRDSKSLFKDVHISTYTYDPLVGMTSETDAKGMTTTYEYDSFQRLKNIKDHNNNIVKHFNYN